MKFSRFLITSGLITLAFLVLPVFAQNTGLQSSTGVLSNQSAPETEAQVQSDELVELLRGFEEIELDLSVFDHVVFRLLSDRSVEIAPGRPAGGINPFAPLELSRTLSGVVQTTPQDLIDAVDVVVIPGQEGATEITSGSTTDPVTEETAPGFPSGVDPLDVLFVPLADVNL